MHSGMTAGAAAVVVIGLERAPTTLFRLQAQLLLFHSAGRVAEVAVVVLQGVVSHLTQTPLPLQGMRHHRSSLAPMQILLS